MDIDTHKDTSRNTQNQECKHIQLSSSNWHRVSKKVSFGGRNNLGGGSWGFRLSDIICILLLTQWILNQITLKFCDLLTNFHGHPRCPHFLCPTMFITKSLLDGERDVLLKGWDSPSLHDQWLYMCMLHTCANTKTAYDSAQDVYWVCYTRLVAAQPRTHSLIWQQCLHRPGSQSL